MKCPLRLTKKLNSLCFLAAATLLADGRPAKAILNYYIYENAGNVIVETSGNLTLPAPISDTDSCGANGAILSLNAAICTGVDTIMDFYSLSLPAAGFGGSAALTGASAVSGISTGFSGSTLLFAIQPGYIDGASIISSATFDGQSLAGLGFNTPGLIGTWTLTGTLDTINVCVGVPGSPCGAPPAVPGPLPLLGAAAAFGYSRRLRRRVSLSRSTVQSVTSISA